MMALRVISCGLCNYGIFSRIGIRHSRPESGNGNGIPYRKGS